MCFRCNFIWAIMPYLVLVILHYLSEWSWLILSGWSFLIMFDCASFSAMLPHLVLVISHHLWLSCQSSYYCLITLWLQMQFCLSDHAFPYLSDPTLPVWMIMTNLVWVIILDHVWVIASSWAISPHLVLVISHHILCFIQMWNEIPQMWKEIPQMWKEIPQMWNSTFVDWNSTNVKPDSTEGCLQSWFFSVTMK